MTTLSHAAPARLTEAAFLHLPDNGRKYELVNGELREVATSVRHDVIGGNVVMALKPAAKGRGYVTISQAGYRMAGGNIRIPDVAYTRRERFPNGILPDGFGDFAPNLCIEIISPSEEAGEQEAKLREYFQSGAELVWHLFPETQTVEVFTAPDVSVTLYPDEELDCPALLPAFRCRVADLFDLE